MRRNSHITTSSKIWPQIWDLRARFPIWREILKIGPRFQVFLAYFLLHMRKNDRNSTSGQIFNPKFETPMGCFLFNYEFWWRLLQDLCMFWAKNGFCNAKFSEFGASGGGGDHFLTKPPKGTSWPGERREGCYMCAFFSLSHSTQVRRRNGRQTQQMDEICYHQTAF